MRSLPFARLTLLFLATWGCETHSQSHLVPHTSQKDDSTQQPEKVLEETAPAWNFSPYFQAHRDLLGRNSFDWGSFEWNSSDRSASDWSLATEELEKLGDHYTLHLIRDRLEMPHDQAQAVQLRQLSERIEQKLAAPACSKENLQFLLERVAYADMMCPEIERSLIEWTQAQIRSLDQSTEIRDELERIRTSYQVKQTKLESEVTESYAFIGLDLQYFYQSMEDRVRWEAKLLLEDQGNFRKN